MPEYADKAMETAGLVITGDGGKRYDRFRDRIMFPIHDGGGRVIGFGGRVLDKGEPKYLNSPETPLFSKGRELYGLFQARQAIRTAGRVVVVEGYMDVVALAQHGVEYAVATLGHGDDAGACAKAVPADRHRRVLFRRRCRRTARRVARAGKHAGGARRRQERPLPVSARRRGSGRLRPQARQGIVRGAGRLGDAAVGLPAGGTGPAPSAAFGRRPRGAGQCGQAAAG